MGLLSRLLGRNDESAPEQVYECATCGETYDLAMVLCEKCGGNDVRKVD